MMHDSPVFPGFVGMYSADCYDVYDGRNSFEQGVVLQ